MENTQVFDVRVYGAKGDGAAKDTTAVQAAIDACTAAGGGTVRVPPGDYLSGTIVLKDNVTLYLEAGATVRGSKELADYAPRHLVYAKGASHITIAGEGTFNGQGSSFWRATAPLPNGRMRAYEALRRPGPMFAFYECRDVRLRDFNLQDSPGWTIHLFYCDLVNIRGIRLQTEYYGPNTDGIDIDACRDVIVSDCLIRTGDDCIVLKNSGRQGMKRMSRNITVTNCLLSSLTNGFKLGTETLDDFENITFSNSVISNDDETRGSVQTRCGIVLTMVDGGHARGISISNIVMRNVRAAIFMRLGNRGNGQQTPTPGTLRDISINNLVATGCDLPSMITGIPGHCIENVSLSNISIEMTGGGTTEMAGRVVPEMEKSYPIITGFGDLPAHGFFVRHARGVRMNNVRVACEQPDARPVMVCDDVQQVEIDAQPATPAAMERLVSPQ